MAITKPPVLPAWADAGDKVQPSNAELSVGWPVSSTPPSRQRFNWALNFVANAVRYFSRRGLVDYDVAETYMIGDRVIGDDGKTYKCLVDNTIAFTPSTNPAKWARWGFTLAELNAEVTTPAQFDNTTKVATTAFVQQAIGGLGRTLYTYSTAGQTIPASQVNSLIYTGGSASTLTLPTIASVPIGSTLTFAAMGTSTVLNRQSADTIWATVDFSSLTSIAVKAGDTLTLMATSFGWLAIGGSAMFAYQGPNGVFGNSLGSSGYQKLPSGLIIQWSSVLTASNTAVWTFPIAFPNQLLGIFSNVGFGGAAHYSGNMGNGTTSSVTITADVAACYVSVLAIGR